ncbi:MAG: tetratricopeptide repeat protein [Parcubacteria group bacterium]|nr:tetratricopeptide repeat protein [Parcubacteria group bacterium]
MEDNNQKNAFDQNKLATPVTIVAWVSVLLLLVAGGFTWYFFSLKTSSLESIIKPGEIREVIGGTESVRIPAGTFRYTIPGVPYVGVHNHIGKNSFIVGDVSGAVASVLEYWNPGKITPAEITERLVRSGSFDFSTDGVEKYVQETGYYVVKKERLTLNEVKKYINEEVRTPLFLLLPLTESQPFNSTFHYYPATVLIGIDEPNGKLIFQSYWLGNNYELSFKDFQRLQNIMSPSGQNQYLIIQPKNLAMALNKIKNLEETPYPPRGIVMKETEEMFKNYTIGMRALSKNNYIEEERHLERVVNDEKFLEFMPPYFKVFALHVLAEAKLALGKMEEAEKYALSAVEFNHDLDKPFKDFPGYEVRGYNTPERLDKISAPYRVLGDIYMRLGEFELAQPAYKNALEINSANNRATRGFRLSEILLKLETNTPSGSKSFAEILVQNSPWNVSWERTEGPGRFSSGTFKMSFSHSSGKEALSGRFFESSIGAEDGSLDNFVIKGNCVSFTFSAGNKNYYYFCFTKKDSLTGIISGFLNNNDFLADIVAISATN